MLHQIERLDVDGFGHDAKAGFLRASARYLQSLLAQALEGVRRSARLVGAAAQHLRSGGLHGPGGFQNLLAAFHRARPGA